MNFHRRLKKTACVFVSAFLVSNTCIVYSIKAQTVDAPLRIETRQIDINDIPADRVINLKVSIDSNPGFSTLFLVFQKDSRLSFDSSPATSFTGIAPISNNTDNGDIIEMSVPTQRGGYGENGDFMELKVRLPDNLSVNDFYGLGFLTGYNDFASCIRTLDQPDCADLSSLNGGGIQITGSTAPPQIPDPPAPPQQEPEPPVANNDPEPQQNDNNNNNNNVNDNHEQQPQTTVSSAAVSTAVSQTTTVTSAASSVSQSKTVKTTSSVTAAKTKKDKQTDASESVTEPSDIIRSEERQKNKFLPAVIAGISCAVIAAAIFIIRKMKTK